MSTSPAGCRITVTGIVQGVGFRPFVYTAARHLGLTGCVRNTPFGVEIDVWGPESAIGGLHTALAEQAPPLAQIDSINAQPLPPATAVPTTFTIAPSDPARHDPRDFVPVSPDVALCADCLAEFSNPADRRYRYPFINCTNCGPRYTIIRSVPYDRPKTTMADFPQCPACLAEYTDPADRRFHAQPNACPVCGPQIWYSASHQDLAESMAQNGSELAIPSRAMQGENAIGAVQRALRDGAIVAIKGIGGFHLACDATNAQAVATLRARKNRRRKPFAVMAADVQTAQRYVECTPHIIEALESLAHPIVLVPMRRDLSHSAPALAELVAPGHRRLGLMLPYSPLHHLLFLPSDHVPDPVKLLVMTSGNPSAEPITHTNVAAAEALAHLADAYLLHNRPIHIPCDDSVITFATDAGSPPAKPAEAVPIPIRRARGYAPTPVAVKVPIVPTLATGAELKNTLCVARDGRAFLSGHLGDLGNLATLSAFEQSARHLQDLFRVQPQVIACDLHPGYLSTRWATEHSQAHNLPLVQVQHHHAHVAALLAEHAHPPDQPIIGVVFDGTGYGPDGTIWGGEWMIAGYAQYRRVGRMQPLPLPGGDAAIRRPYRMALAALWHHNLPWHAPLAPATACPAAEQRLLQQQLERNFNCVATSSMGRLFDAVAALAGICTHAEYEAQGAMELETAAAPLLAQSSPPPYPFTLSPPAAPGARNLGQSAQDQVEFEIVTQALFREIAATLYQESHAGQLNAGQTDQNASRPSSPVEHRDLDLQRARIAARWHVTVAEMIVTGCRHIQARHGLSTVGLTGGVFQNAALLEQTLPRLRRAGFQVLVHRRVPANDGGLALGQAVVAGFSTHQAAQSGGLV